MNIYISGGAKNGKSTFAQRKAKALAEAGGTELYYVATMIARDSEDDARVARHRREREGWGFTTLEVPTGISKVPRIADPEGTFLLDSVTALLQNEMFRDDGTVDTEAGERVAEELALLAAGPGNWVMVSDYLFADPGPFGEYTEIYRKSLAAIDRHMAGICEAVVEISAGIAVYHKGDN